MRTSSAKAKGRRKQQEVAARLRQLTGLTESDICSRPMGSPGCDVMMSAAALSRIPYSIECKNVEKINIWQAFEQAKANSTSEHAPLLVFSKNRSDTLVCLTFEDFLKLL